MICKKVTKRDRPAETNGINLPIYFKTSLKVENISKMKIHSNQVTWFHKSS